MKMLVVVMVVCMCYSGCSQRPAQAWQPEQAEAVAWWIEDVAHGLERDPGELEFTAGGRNLQSIAAWAAGSRINGQWIPPQQLMSRRNRWPTIKSGLAHGDIVSAPVPGLIASSPELAPVRRQQIDAIIDIENEDRRFIDGLILTLGHPDIGVARAYEDAVRRARKAHDVVEYQPATNSPQTTH
ncbi:MAG: hypothetical protein AAB263_01780 [Planctomycetota bacterium]